MRRVLCAAGAIALVALAAAAAPIVEGPRSGVTALTCRITNGNTTCAVSQGRVSVCSRRTGGDIRRSFMPYDYLDDPKGCALDQSYWRDHGRKGSGPFDTVWNRVGSRGPETPFFGSNRSWFELLSQEPAADSYRRLARAYIATELNRLNGAALPPTVTAAYNETVTILLGTGATLPSELVARSGEIASTLEAYLSGKQGPGLCAPLKAQIGPGDVGKPVKGIVSSNDGRITKLEFPKTAQAGEPIIEIRPKGPKDLFVVADEDFAVGDIRKGRFTQSVNDCATVATGQQVTVPVGGRPGALEPTDPTMLQDARNLQIMIALNSENPATGPTPSSGPTAPPPSEGPPGPGPIGAPGGIGFPSPSFPPTAGGGGADFVTVPDVVGLTDSQARGRINSADLRVGNVAIVSLEPVLRPGGVIATAFAQTGGTEPIVVGQSPSPGTLVAVQTQVNLQESQQSGAMPEPPSLPLFVIALAALLLLWRRRAGGGVPH